MTRWTTIITKDFKILAILMIAITKDSENNNYMRQYTIAGHTIQLSGKGLNSLPGLDVFFSGKPEKEPLLVIDTDIPVCDCDVSPFFSFENEGTCSDLSIKDNGFFFRIKQRDGSRLLAEIRREGDCFRAAVNWTGVFSEQTLKSGCWSLFGIAALSRQTVSIHASTVTVQGKSTLFLGESGTGKSTQTGLWLQHIPGAELLNDDSPFIRVKPDGSIRVYGSPWSGKKPCYKNRQTPIAAFVRVSQAPHNRIRRLKGAEAIGALQPSCPYSFSYNEQLSESIYSIISQTLLQAPVYHLECLPDADAARLTYSTLVQDHFL